ncbi:MAG: M24 family metallopeptidase [Anaerolineae bacterium]|nr:M24 family metallopeptidase [Anaerolineae bacterium]
MDYTAEVQTKLAQLRALMAEKKLDAIWLRSVNNVAWITGGIDAAVNMADTEGVVTVVVTADKAQILASTIEGPRVSKGDGAEARGFEVLSPLWAQAAGFNMGTALGADLATEGAVNLGREIALLRSRLQPVEVERFRALGRACAGAMEAAIGRVHPGMTEYEIAGALANETFARGVTPIVNLIATDERIFNFRHPLPTSKVMDRYAMLVLCGRKEGLVCSVTRLVHFGELPDELRTKINACAIIDAKVNLGSKPGKTLGEMFDLITAAYAEVGFAGEWQLHHQGGTAGYGAREFLAVPGETAALDTNMVCAWNPSITGVKVEDSILITPDGPEVLTEIAGWPTVAVEVDGATLARPVIKEVM